MRGLYRSGLFIKLDRARDISNSGLLFLRSYAICASMAFARGARRFCMVPKLHFFNHILLELRQQSESKTARWACNPLTYSVQLQEGFIGRPSRLSRRVSARKHAVRTLQRVLACMHAEYKRVEGVKNTSGACTSDVQHDSIVLLGADVSFRRSDSFRLWLLPYYVLFFPSVIG